MEWHSKIARFTFNDESLCRHGITRYECLEVLADPLRRFLNQEESERGHPHRLYVGFTLRGRCLEIGVELTQEEEEQTVWHVYHANRARKIHREKLGL